MVSIHTSDGVDAHNFFVFFRQGGAPRGTRIQQKYMHVHIYKGTYKFTCIFTSDGVNKGWLRLVGS